MMEATKFVQHAQKFKRTLVRQIQFDVLKILYKTHILQELFTCFEVLYVRI